MRKAVILFFCLPLSGCMLWPYKADFDCPHPEGESCRSLYEINQLADQQMFAPTQENLKPCCKDTQ